MDRARMYWIVLILIVLVPVYGCDSAATNDEPLPTLVEFPSATASDIPSDTPDATSTPEPTATFTLTPTSSFTPSQVLPSNTPTITSTPSNTATPRATFTNTLTPSAIPGAATATPGETSVVIIPTSDVTTDPDAPRIISFQSNLTSASVGESVMLIWEAVGDVARIDRIDQLGQVAETFSVTPTGQLPVTIPANSGSAAVYRLTVTRGTQTVTATLTIVISGGALTCPINWFFGNTLAPPTAGCPPAAAIQVPGAYQPFQTGRMIFIQNTIYALIDNQTDPTTPQGVMSQSPNGWDGTSTYESYGAIYPTCAETIPVGLYAPQQMFAYLYCTGLAPGGLWRDLLGFATTPLDGSQRTIQLESTGAIYVEVPGGGVYRLEPVPAGSISSQWQKIR